LHLIQIGFSMQRFKILHRTYYNFSNTVRLGPHYLRLRPREDHELHVDSFRVNITPTAKLNWQRDVEGNSVAIATFTTHTAQLAIESEVYIQQFNETPLDFLLSDYAINYPFAYLENERFLLLPYMAYPEPEAKNQLDKWITNFWQPGEAIQSYSLLQRLSTYINQSLSYRIREEEGVQSAKQTLENASGSCRDFALLFMQTARCLGFAARFVSGYLHTAPSATDYGATHAWAEVYLPGVGWKGFDPTSGILVGSDHIAVAVALMPESVPSVSGTFFGEAESELDVGVWVSKC